MDRMPAQEKKKETPHTLASPQTERTDQPPTPSATRLSPLREYPSSAENGDALSVRTAIVEIGLVAILIVGGLYFFGSSFEDERAPAPGRSTQQPENMSEHEAALGEAEGVRGENEISTTVDF